LREGLRQESIMQQVMRMSDIENKWNSEDVEKKILEFLK
jgi:hypothetical protein